MAVKHRLLKDPLEEVERLQAELKMLTEAVGEALSAIPAPQVVEVAKEPQRGPTGPQGASGKDGEGLTWRGNWEEKQTYNKNDVVNYLGSSYIATKTTTKDYPNRVNNGWDLLAASGASGASAADPVDAGAPCFEPSSKRGSPAGQPRSPLQSSSWDSPFFQVKTRSTLRRGHLQCAVAFPLISLGKKCLALWKLGGGCMKVG